MKKLHKNLRSRKLYRWTAICVASFLIFMSGITSLAAQIGTVQSDNVNVRSEADASSSSVCKLPADTVVDVIGQNEGADGQIWYNVSFIYEETEQTGWIRGDMLAVSEIEDSSEAGGASGGYSIVEPEEAYAGSDALTQTSLTMGDGSVTVWQVDSSLTGGQELYLVYASKADGSTGWFYYDPQENTFQRDMGQFSGGAGESEGLIEALQNELTQRQEEHEKQLSQRLYIIIGLGVLSVILLVLVIIFAIKYRDAAYEYYDDDEDDDSEEDSDEIKGSSKSYGDDGFDDFVKAVKKKWAEPEDDDEYDDEDEYDEEDDEYEDDEYDGEEYDDEDYDDEYDDEEEDVEDDEEIEEEIVRKKEKRKEKKKKEEKKKEVREEALEEDFSGILPEIDMSAVLEVEKEAKKTKGKKKYVPEEDDQDSEDDFDIDILDLDDLDL